MANETKFTDFQRMEIEYWNAVERGADQRAALLTWSGWLCGDSTYSAARDALRQMRPAAAVR
jgi:hypothetical protein